MVSRTRKTSLRKCCWSIRRLSTACGLSKKRVKLQPLWGGADAFWGEVAPKASAAGAHTLLDFLTNAEWGRVHQAARHLFHGVAAGIQGRAAVGTAALRELVEFAFADGLQEIEGWLDFGQAAEDLEALENDVWSGGTILREEEASSMLSWRLADFLEQAATVKSFWTEAGSHANRKGKDFVQQAADLSGALPEAEAWQVCEPLEREIIAFVHRVAGGGDGVFTHEAAGNFALLAEAVEDCMRRARELQISLQALSVESRAHAGPSGRRPSCERLGDARP